MPSRTQIDRLGERLKQAIATEEDLTELDEYRRSSAPAYAEVVAGVQSLDFSVTGRPSKSTSSIVDKLRRESCRLSQIQDIAGCRIVVPTLLAQDSAVKSICGLFPELRVVDRRKSPSHGYRAVHLIHRSRPVPVEIQVRSFAQHAWAEVSEKLSDRFGTEVKYGGGPTLIRQFLDAFSFLADSLENKEAAVLELQHRSNELHRARVEDRIPSEHIEEFDKGMVELDADLAKQQQVIDEARAGLQSILANISQLLEE